MSKDALDLRNIHPRPLKNIIRHRAASLPLLIRKSPRQNIQRSKSALTASLAQRPRVDA